jgi:hypothetical protein
MGSVRILIGSDEIRRSDWWTWDEKDQINFDKTILQYDDTNDYSDRPTFNDIVELDDDDISFSDQLEDDPFGENYINQQKINSVHQN